MLKLTEVENYFLKLKKGTGLVWGSSNPRIGLFEGFPPFQEYHALLNMASFSILFWKWDLELDWDLKSLIINPGNYKILPDRSGLWDCQKKEELLVIQDTNLFKKYFPPKSLNKKYLTHESSTLRNFMKRYYN